MPGPVECLFFRPSGYDPTGRPKKRRFTNTHGALDASSAVIMAPEMSLIRCPPPGSGTATVLQESRRFDFCFCTRGRRRPTWTRRFLPARARSTHAQRNCQQQRVVRIQHVAVHYACCAATSRCKLSFRAVRYNGVVSARYRQLLSDHSAFFERQLRIAVCRFPNRPTTVRAERSFFFFFISGGSVRRNEEQPSIKMNSKRFEK